MITVERLKSIEHFWVKSDSSDVVKKCFIVGGVVPDTLCHLEWPSDKECEDRPKEGDLLVLHMSREESTERFICFEDKNIKFILCSMTNFEAIQLAEKSGYTYLGYQIIPESSNKVLLSKFK